jgi:hypothetical protein
MPVAAVSASQQTVSRIPAAVPVWTSRSRKLSSGRKFAFRAHTVHSSALSRAEPSGIGATTRWSVGWCGADTASGRHVRLCDSAAMIATVWCPGRAVITMSG